MMKKYSLLFLLSIATASLTGCGHQHTWANKWSSNSTEHWQDATCEHAGQIVANKGVHEDGDNNNACDICGRPLGEHQHTFSPNWTWNEESHWHEATCGHAVTSEYSNHIDQNKDGYCDTCRFKMQSDENKIVKIEIKGNLAKTSYAWDDKWDLAGLYVEGTTLQGTKRQLLSSEFSISTLPKAPKNLTSGLVINAKYLLDDSVSTSRTINSIKVADEVYDEESEINAYYSSCNLSLTGSSMMNELHRHSFLKHTTFVKYVDTGSYITKGKDNESPDVIPNKHKTEMFYTGNQVNYAVGSREHVWACNDSSGLWPHGKVDASDYYGGGSDLYHVRPCNSQVNTARGDAPYVDFDDSEFSSYKSQVVEVGDSGPYKLSIYGATKTSSGAYEFAKYVEPADEFKGDIARIVAYLYMHYNTNSNTPSSYKSLTGGLYLTKVIGYSTEAKAKAKLKEWNNLDPVNEVEKRRNHSVQQIQGNRNPFVDYPDLIDKVF